MGQYRLEIIENVPIEFIILENPIIDTKMFVLSVIGKKLDISELNYPLIRLITLISGQLMIGDH